MGRRVPAVIGLLACITGIEPMCTNDGPGANLAATKDGTAAAAGPGYPAAAREEQVVPGPPSKAANASAARGPGQVRWRTEAGRTDLPLAPVPATDVIFAAGVRFASTSDAGLIEAFDPRTGRRVWSVEPGESWSAGPVVAGDVVLYGTARLQGNERSGRLVALDRRSGRARWEVAARGHVGAPAVVGGSAYFGSDDGRLYAVDLALGLTRWSHDTGDRIEAPVSAGGGRVHAVNSKGRVLALDEDGRVSWEATVAGVWPTALLVTDESLVLVDRARTLVGIAVGGSMPAWRFDATTANRQGLDPVYSSRTVCFRDGQRVRGLDPASGRPLWEKTVGGDVHALVAAGELVLAATREGTVHALRGADGAVAWTLPVDGEVLAPPALDGSRLYLIVADRVPLGQQSTRWLEAFE